MNKHLAIIACIASLIILFMLMTQEEPQKRRHDGYNPPLLWGYGDDEYETNCGDNIDDDSDGLTDCADSSDCSSASECAEDCDNEIDDDADGATDCADLACSSDPACM
jgi:hypothetical protein